MSTSTRIFRSSLAAAMSLLLWGCAGSSNSQAPQFSNNTGQHPTGWLSAHGADYAKHPDQCATCHGSSTDPSSTGGISKVSCFTCHPSGPGHPIGWRAGLQHGRLGAQGVWDPATNRNGMASCERCHGADLAGGIVAISCLQCHSKAPQPNRPWISTSLTQSRHTLTSFTNAPKCYQCHANGSNFAGTPPPVPVLGTPPGCFNNTMCHGAQLG